MSRVALVTGASRGIGAAAAPVALARRGVHVVLTARTQGGLEETDDAVRAAGGTATLLPLDLADGESLDAVGPSLLDRFGRLDVLGPRRGGAGQADPGAAHPAQGLRGGDGGELCQRVAADPQLVARCCWPGRPGARVFVTDGLADAPRAYWGLYGASKAAMQHLALSWAEEARNTACRVNVFDPGVVATRLRAEAMPGEDSRRLVQPKAVAEALAGAVRGRRGAPWGRGAVCGIA